MKGAGEMVQQKHIIIREVSEKNDWVKDKVFGLLDKLTGEQLFILLAIALVGIFVVALVLLFMDGKAIRRAIQKKLPFLRLIKDEEDPKPTDPEPDPEDDADSDAKPEKPAKPKRTTRRRRKPADDD